MSSGTATPLSVIISEALLGYSAAVQRGCDEDVEQNEHLRSVCSGCFRPATAPPQGPRTGPSRMTPPASAPRRAGSARPSGRRWPHSVASVGPGAATATVGLVFGSAGPAAGVIIVSGLGSVS